MRNALVPLAVLDRDTTHVRAGRGANADFMAHLIATAAQAPQTRARRRARPDEVVAAYRALGQWTSAVGRTISRSL